MLERLKQALGGPASHGFAECRRCGTRLEAAANSCVECGSTEVARYDL